MLLITKLTLTEFRQKEFIRNTIRSTQYSGDDGAVTYLKVFIYMYVEKEKKHQTCN